MPAVLPLLALLCGASPSVAVVDVESPDMMMGLAGQVTRTVVTEAQAQGLALVSPEQLRARLEAPRYEQLKKCAGKVACVAQLLGGTGAERAVVGQLSRDERHYLLKLWLLDLKALTVIADVDRRILIAARRFQRDVEQAVPPLLRGEREARGTLVVESNVADAQVSVDGEFIGTPPVKLALRPGKYEVRVERRKYLGGAKLVAVEANQQTTEFIKLLLKPGEVADDAPGAGKGQKGGGPRPISLSALTYVAGGLAVASAATGLGFGFVSRSQAQALTRGFDSASGVYQGTRAQALEQNRNAVIANVAFTAAGIAAAATVVSIIIDANRAPAVQVAPVVAPGAAGVSVGGSF